MPNPPNPIRLSYIASDQIQVPHSTASPEMLAYYSCMHAFIGLSKNVTIKLLSSEVDTVECT